MEWDKGFSASYYMAVVDPVSWRDVGRIEILGGSINRDLAGLRHSADINCKDYDQSAERWIRVYLDAKQAGDGQRIPLFTGMATSPDRDIKGSWYENNVQCYSVLKPADDVILPRGWYAPAEMSCSPLIKQLLAPVPAPIAIQDDGPELESHIIGEDGETNLTMLERILTAVNWNLKILGDGSIEVGPFSDESVCSFGPLENDSIETEMQVTTDWFSCPNVFMAVNNDRTGIARDESEDSPLSIQNRGREVWMYESGSNISVTESIDEYAKRRLKEEQRYATTVSYDRRYHPNVFPGDFITLRYPDQDLFGDFIVESQSIELGYGARVSEIVMGIL